MTTLPQYQRGQRAGVRVLIVEDQFMSALALMNSVEQLGVEVVGPAPNVREALRLIDEGPFNGALLDINLGDETVEPVARRLQELGCPFVFVTGYASPKLSDPGLKGHKIVPKPVDSAILHSVMKTEFNIG